MFERPALFGPLTVTGGLFPSQVASRPTTFRDTSRLPPGTAVLLLNTRSRPTWLSPTMSADGPNTPASAVLPVMIMSRPTVFAGWPFRAQMLPIPNPSVTERFVMLKSCTASTSQMPSKTNGRSGEPWIAKSWPTFSGAARSVRADLPGLHRLRLRREEVVPDRETLGVDSVGEAQELDVVADRDAGDVEAGVLPEREHVVLDRRVEDLGAGLVAGGDDVVADGRIHDARSRVVLEAHVVADARPRDIRARVVLLNQVMSDRRAGHGAVAAGRNNQVVRRAREGVRHLRADGVRRPGRHT